MFILTIADKTNSIIKAHRGTNKFSEKYEKFIAIFFNNILKNDYENCKKTLRLYIVISSLFTFFLLGVFSHLAQKHNLTHFNFYNSAQIKELQFSSSVLYIIALLFLMSKNEFNKSIQKLKKLFLGYAVIIFFTIAVWLYFNFETIKNIQTISNNLSMVEQTVILLNILIISMLALLFLFTHVSHFLGYLIVFAFKLIAKQCKKGHDPEKLIIFYIDFLPSCLIFLIGVFFNVIRR